MSHHLRMILGCILPLLLVFLLPLFGVSENIAVFVFIVLMFGCHLLMIGHRGHELYHHRHSPSDGGHHHEQD